MTDPGLDRTDVADACARAIHDAFLRFQQAYLEITRLARRRFASRDWPASQADAQRRLDLYSEVLDSLQRLIPDLLGEEATNRDIWKVIKASYSESLHDELNPELARTFFNSLTRKLFATVGVDASIEFVEDERPVHEPTPELHVFDAASVDGDPASLLRLILQRHEPGAPFANLDDDVLRGARLFEEQLRGATDAAEFDRVETLPALFYRNKGTYVVGRIVAGGRNLPLLLPLTNGPDGVQLDGVLMHPDEVSIIFSFTRSYFHVDVERAAPLVSFLRTIMPLKPVSELYSAVGRNKHGKTVLFASLQEHLRHTDDRFEVAEGDEGMVMLVFTLASFGVVFKVIRDRFGFPKTTTRSDVTDRYRLVFKHDRAGRLVDAQEFEHLRFRRDRFDPELLEQLLTGAAKTVRVVGDDVVIQHLYTERKVTPLNLFLRAAGEGVSACTVMDYGQAIKDLAAANIFAGDFLLKNFGVTRHGRVVFYDYDELCLVRDCRFRKMPPARNPEEEFETEPWFTVRDNDVFPEEFERFLGLSVDLRRVFNAAHADLFTAEYWCTLQERLARGDIVDVVPYPRSRRLHPLTPPRGQT